MSGRSWSLAVLVVTLAFAGCSKSEGKKQKDGEEKKKTEIEVVSPAGDTASIESNDILARPEASKTAEVKHVLLAWKDLAAVYRGRIDKRAKDRTHEQAIKLAGEIADKLRADPKAIDALVKQHSEDPGSLSGNAYSVTPDSQFVPEFKKLALRLKMNEVGIVKTQFGYHVMERVEPTPPDPLESADILARPAKAKEVRVQHILIGWKDVPAASQMPVDPRASKRTKAEADAMAKSMLDKVRGGGDMTALMKKFSEDPGSKDTGKAYDVTPAARMVPPFKNLSLRLDIGEAGLVLSPFGWHVIKRVPPPPPDNLESRDILARTDVAPKTKVKHILLGWTEAHTSDPRGTKRTRAQLEKLVNKTVAALRKGKPIEALMAKLSEDPGSAKTGNSYDASPTASLVPPFKALSLRLKKDEVGVVKTQFGIHIIKRIE